MKRYITPSLREKAAAVPKKPGEWVSIIRIMYYGTKEVYNSTVLIKFCRVKAF